jgi:hypothetical protein
MRGSAASAATRGRGVSGGARLLRQTEESGSRGPAGRRLVVGEGRGRRSGLELGRLSTVPGDQGRKRAGFAVKGP